MKPRGEQSDELFYLDEDGVARDAELHEPILAQGDEAAAFAVTYRLLKEGGQTEEFIASTYGELYLRFKSSEGQHEQA